MKLIVVHKDILSLNAKPDSQQLLRFAVCYKPLFDILLNEFNNTTENHGKDKNFIAIPQDWSQAEPHLKKTKNIISYDQNLPVPVAIRSHVDKDGILNISNGQFLNRIDSGLLENILTRLDFDVLTLNATYKLKASHEKIITTRDNKLIGFRRLYANTAQPASTPKNWPDQLFVTKNAFKKLHTNYDLPLKFGELIKMCINRKLRICSLNIAAETVDLNTEQGLLSLLDDNLDVLTTSKTKNSRFIPNKAKLFGKIFIDNDVSVDPDAIITGPTIIGRNVKIANGSVVRKSIIAPNMKLKSNQIIQYKVITSQSQLSKNDLSSVIKPQQKQLQNNGFMIWPKFSYPAYFKRIFDIIVSAIVLILFAPVLPIIALVVKLSLPGPVFFTDKRQGLYGRKFNCLKFRTMIVGADKIQAKLRVLNMADGPQFTMKNDPRLNAVGLFLRNTYIDEIPQFFNVLLGHMSIVGPRPSPESENTLCPYWRDARLSVRPGVTGLWQVLRTRNPGRDFQEWIYYDTKYIRKLSFGFDLWICLKTAGKMVRNFINQF